jgi:hypothetical protein
MALVLRAGATFPLALAVQADGAPLGDVFRFTSGLYFRGKLAYAEAFAAPVDGLPGTLVIAPGAGLLPPERCVRAADLRAFAAVPVDPRDDRYRAPLERDARALADKLGPSGEVVLLGSIASGKYVEPLLAIYGERLLFPGDFVGRGDMSRGGLLLRCVRAGQELAYVPVAGAVRHGVRPPRLPRVGWAPVNPSSASPVRPASRASPPSPGGRRRPA